MLVLVQYCENVAGKLRQQKEQTSPNINFGLSLSSLGLVHMKASNTISDDLMTDWLHPHPDLRFPEDVYADPAVRAGAPHGQVQPGGTEPPRPRAVALRPHRPQEAVPASLLAEALLPIREFF